MGEQPIAKKWYQKTWVVIFSFFVFFPVGFYLVSKHPTWHKKTKDTLNSLAVIGLVSFIILSIIFAPPSLDVTSALTPVRGSTYTLTGTIDPSGAVVTVNGKKVTVRGDKFSVGLDLKEGDNVITIDVVDGSKQTEKVIKIHRYTKSEVARFFPTITHKTITATRNIDFSSKTVHSSSLAKGVRQITTAGIKGKEMLVYMVTYSNGKEVKRKFISTRVIKKPIAQVTTIGTYVYVAPKPAPALTTTAVPSCPNGTYVNSYGSTVCSPYASSSTPAGATAKCRDGTYSFSQHHSGTCSYHGGVSEWL